MEDLTKDVQSESIPGEKGIKDMFQENPKPGQRY